MLSINRNKIKPCQLGLTGNYCSGKTTCCHHLEKMGFKIIELDKLGHLALTQQCNEIASIFGNDIMNQHHQIDRLKLRKKVFTNFTLLDKLESIIHPIIKKLLWQTLEGYEEKPIVLCAANLIAMNLHEFCEKLVLIKSDINHIKKRAEQRDGSESYLIERVLTRQNQMQHKHQHYVDFIINNNLSIAHLKRQLQDMQLAFGWQYYSDK